MKTASKDALIIIFGIVLVALTALTMLAMVVAPSCTGIMQKASAYRLGSISVFIPLFYFSAWRKRSLPAAVLIPLAQFGFGWSFITYLNSLPMICP